MPKVTQMTVPEWQRQEEFWSGGLSSSLVFVFWESIRLQPSAIPWLFLWLDIHPQGLVARYLSPWVRCPKIAIFSQYVLRDHWNWWPASRSPFIPLTHNLTLVLMIISEGSHSLIFIKQLCRGGWWAPSGKKLKEAVPVSQQCRTGGKSGQAGGHHQYIPQLGSCSSRSAPQLQQSRCVFTEEIIWQIGFCLENINFKKHSSALPVWKLFSHFSLNNFFPKVAFHRDLGWRKNNKSKLYLSNGKA